MHKIKLKNSDNVDVAREYPDYRFHITDSIILLLTGKCWLHLL